MLPGVPHNPTTQCPSHSALCSVAAAVLVEQQVPNDKEARWELQEYIEPGASSMVAAGVRLAVSNHPRFTFLVLDSHESEALTSGTAGQEGTEAPESTAARTMHVPKRQRLSPSAATGIEAGNSSSVQRQQEGARAQHQHQPPGVEQQQQQQDQLEGAKGPPRGVDAPFHLLRVRPLTLRNTHVNVPEWANTGFVGARLADLVAGEGMRWAFVMNFMVDMRWLLSACPDLMRVERLVVVHGEGSGLR
jgi:hypothetical protein